MNTQSVFEYVKKKYNTDPDYPWNDSNVVLRHSDSRKWYAVVMKVRADKLGMSGTNLVEVMNVKCDPALISVLRTKEGFFPAYHMNKDSWISILLDERVSEQEVKQLLDLSYELTQTEKKAR